jgi:hypothetical protein
MAAIPEIENFERMKSGEEGIFRKSGHGHGCQIDQVRQR